MSLKAPLMRLQRIKSARAALLAVAGDIGARPPWLAAALSSLAAMERRAHAEAAAALPVSEREKRFW